MKLIVGLGNIGKEYDNTRHNVGFKALDKILNKYNVNLTKNKFDGYYEKININDEQIIFLKPAKYMNLSGEVIKKYVDYFKINLDDILIISDDLDQALGKFKLKIKGRSGGHNGLKDIEKNLNTNEYKRIKIGISNNKNIDTKDYVLGKISKEENEQLNKIYDIIVNIFDDYLKMNFEDLMNKYNRKN
jgi:PTH1 family peptidyl-tRNA hydrolase